MESLGISLGINGRYLAKESATGVGRWSFEVVKELQRRASVPFIIHRPGHEWASGLKGHLWEQTILPARHKRTECPLLLSPANFGPILTRGHVITIHDIAPVLLPGLFAPAYAKQCRILLPRMLKRATRILAVSDKTKSDIVEAFSIPPDNIVVVGGGGGHLAVPSGKPGDYFLFVGGHDKRKNLDFLVRLWPEVFRRTGLRLLVTYRSAQGVTILSSSLRTDGVVSPAPPWLETIADPTDSELADIYSAALAVLQPSFFEGLGLPLLEATSAGIPFVSSDVGIASEIAVATWQVQPLVADNWVDVLSDPARLMQLRGLEPTRARREFSWERTADRVATALAASE